MGLFSHYTRQLSLQLQKPYRRGRLNTPINAVLFLALIVSPFLLIEKRCSFIFIYFYFFLRFCAVCLQTYLHRFRTNLLITLPGKRCKHSVKKLQRSKTRIFVRWGKLKRLLPVSESLRRVSILNLLSPQTEFAEGKTKYCVSVCV